MRLSPRLSALAGYYNHHTEVWDIGCDHGKLGLSFYENEEVKSIHLVDPSEPVIDKLKQLVDSYITVQNSKLVLHHKKGQEIIPGPDKKLVLIAGMGGKEIEAILSAWTNFLSLEDDVVISPHRDILLLREWLSESPFSLGDESLVFDEDRYYQVLSLNLRMGEKVHPFGEKIFSGERGESYRLQQLSTFSAHKDVRSGAYADYLRKLTQCF